MRDDMISIVDIREKMADYRKKAGLSKDAMAIMCGVSGLTYVRWESGATRTIKKENYEALCKALEKLENDV